MNDTACEACGRSILAQEVEHTFATHCGTLKYDHVKAQYDFYGILK